MKGGARGVLNAVIGPQRLRAVIERDLLKGLAARMGAREGAMPPRMPILGQRHMRETLAQLVRDRNDFVALGHRERAAGAEIILHIDDEENVLVTQEHGANSVSRRAGARLTCPKRCQKECGDGESESGSRRLRLRRGIAYAWLQARLWPRCRGGARRPCPRFRAQAWDCDGPSRFPRAPRGEGDRCRRYLHAARFAWGDDQ